MTQNALLLIGTLFRECWKFFVSFNIPGTNFTPGLAFLSLSVITLFVKFIRSWVGFGSGASGSAHTIARLRDKNE